METKKSKKKGMDLLTAVEQVVEFSKGSHLNEEFFKNAAKPLKFISEKMELTKEQSIMMALFIDNSSDSSITVSDFAKHLDCSMTKIIRLMNDVDGLEQKGLVLCSRDRQSVSYRVPLDVVEAFKHNVKYGLRRWLARFHQGFFFHGSRYQTLLHVLGTNQLSWLQHPRCSSDDFLLLCF